MLVRRMRLVNRLPERATQETPYGVSLLATVEISVDDVPSAKQPSQAVDIPDEAITVDATFTYKSPRAPLCNDCRMFEQDAFTGSIPYKLAGRDMTEWIPTQEVVFAATGTCQCGGMTTWKITAKQDSQGKLDVTFEPVEKDRLSRVVKNMGAMSHLPNYRR